MSFTIERIRCPACRARLECAVPVRPNTTSGGPNPYDIECPICSRFVTVTLLAEPMSVNKGWHG